MQGYWLCRAITSPGLPCYYCQQQHSLTIVSCSQLHHLASGQQQVKDRATLLSCPAPFTPVHAADEGLQLRPVDVRTTGTTQYEDPLHVDEAIVFYRVTLDPALRELGAN